MNKLLSAVLSGFIFLFAFQVFGQALNQVQFITGSQIELLGTSTATFEISTKASGGNSISISTREAAGGSGIYIASSTNNIGIGTTTPIGKFTIGLNNSNDGITIDGTVGYRKQLIISENGSQQWRTGVTGTSGNDYAFFDGTQNALVLKRGGDAYFTPAGNVGIGTSTPSTKLHVYVTSGNAGTFNAPITVGYPAVSTDAATKSYVDTVAGIAQSASWVQSGSYLYPSSTSWSVGIGTTTPITKLSVYGAENDNRISQGGASIPYTELAQRSWGGNNAIFFGAYATSTYVNGDFLTAGNSLHKYASSSFGATDHRAKALIGDHLGIGFYISGVSPGANQNVTWNQEFYVSPSNIYIPTNNVGIGESAPGSKLSVSGNATIGANYDTVAGPSNGLAVEGSVGIGTTTPAIKLHIQDGNVRVNNTTATSTIEIRGTSNSVNPRLHLSEDGASGGTLMFDSTANTLNLMTGTSLEAYSPRIVIARDTGNIGIATTSPQAQFHSWNLGDNDLIVEADADNVGEDDNPRVILRQDGNLVNGLFGIMGATNQYSDALPNTTFVEAKDNGGGAALQFVTGGTAIGGTNGTARMTILAGGNIGIATSSPSAKLSVYSASGNAATFNQPITVGYPTVSTDAATKSYVDTVAGVAQSAAWVQSGSYLYPSSTSWSVGIGNTAPAGKLDITHSFTQGSNSSLNFGARGITAASGSGIVSNLYGAYFEANLNTSAAGGAPSTANNYGIYAKASSTNYAHNNSGTTNYYGGYFEATGSTDGADTTKNYGIYVNAAGGDTNYSGVFMGGNLGIGTTTPGYTLDISGIARASTYFISPALYLSGGATEVGNAAGSSPRLVFGASGITTTGTGSISLTSGNLGVGGAASSYKLDVTGTANISSSVNLGSNLTTNGQITANNLSASGGVFLGNNGNGTGDEAGLYDTNNGYSLAVMDYGDNIIYHGPWLGQDLNSGIVYSYANFQGNGSVSVGTTLSVAATSTLTGNVGIGATPQAKLHVALPAWTNHDTNSQHAIFGDGSTDGGVRIGYNSSSRIGIINTLDPGAWWGSLILQSGGGKVGIGTTTPATTLQVIGTITATKLNADEVDPPYTINGKKYATYMAGMTGLKEETSGVVRIKNGKAVLDLANAEEGSDLWVFAQTINLAGKIYVSEGGEIHKTNSDDVLNDIIVLLTPGFNGRVWYEKKDGKILISSSEKNGEISYRLTAPRFDAVKKNGNLRTGDDVEGLNLDKLLK